jgi:hypothetical protein
VIKEKREEKNWNELKQQNKGGEKSEKRNKDRNKKRGNKQRELIIKMWRRNGHLGPVAPKPTDPKTSKNILITGYSTHGRMPQRSCPYTECKEFTKRSSDACEALANVSVSS